MEPTSPNRCLATRADGSPCRATPSTSGYCFAHDPALREKTAAARQQGGQNRSNVSRANKRMPQDLQSLTRELWDVLRGVKEGDIAPARAHAVANLAGQIVRVYTAGDLERRIEQLEARASAVAKSRGG